MSFSIARMLFGFLLLLPLQFALAGGLRFYLGINLSLANACVLPFIALFLSREGQKIYLRSIQQLILCLVIFAYFLARLYNSELGALVSYGCADAANHLGLYRTFLTQDPKTYFGFNALYVTWWFFAQVLGLNLTSSLTLALTFPIFSLAYLIAYFSPDVKLTRKQIFEFGVFVTATVVLSESCLLPLLHYNQADGYLGHLFSISTFLFVIFFGAKLSFPALFASIAACRFSYSLQLPELLVGIALYLAIYALRANTTISKWRFGLTSAAMMIVALLGISKLTAAFSLTGSILSQNLDSAFSAQIAGVALLLSIGSAISLEIFFLISASVIQAFWLLATEESEYYFSKLFLYSSLALVIIALRELPKLLSIRSSLRTASWVVLVSLLVLAQRPYIPSFLERTVQGGSYRLISPLLDSKVQEIIDEVIIKENKGFFRYFTSRWAQYSFFNNLYNVTGTFESFTQPPTAIPKNSCIFWTNNSNDIPRLEKYPAPLAIEWLKAMNLRKDTKEVKYQVTWAGRQEIRYLCSEGEDLVLAASLDSSNNPR